MNILRNFIGIIFGLATALTIVTIGLRIDSRWYSDITSHDINSWKDLYNNWRVVLNGVREEFFISLFISSCLGVFFGGITTALIVKRAKVAYGLLIGLILSLISHLELIFIPNHPLWYKIAIWFAFFPIAWVGSKFIEYLTESKN